jgi:hypothetical protein
MRKMKLYQFVLPLFLMVLSYGASAQISSVEELEFEEESTKSVYKPRSRNFVYMKSKKGEGGVPKIQRADSILTTPVTELVLVYTELTEEASEDREQGNIERWTNLFETYPEFFQHNGTTFRNLCQCNAQGDAEAFKAGQGFYIFYKAPEPVKEVAKPAAPPEAPKPPVAEKKVIEEPKTSSVTKTKEEPKVKEEVKKTDTETPKAEEKVAKEVPAPVVQEKVEEPVESEEPVVVKTPKPIKSGASKKRPGYEKPRRAKDSKACRQPCYESGDEDLVLFWKNSVTLTKKQKKKGKKINVLVKLQLNYDGSIKKAFVTGEDEVLNQQVQSAVDQMGYWNPAVKAGLTVRSEVKFTLKYDKPSKSVRPMDFVINPRPGLKCPCISDSELFGD